VPELPEVETVRRGLAPVMEGRLILEADVRRPDLRWPLPERMAERLLGQRVLRLRPAVEVHPRRSLLGRELLIHLGMSGRMLVSGAMLGDFHFDHPAPAKHDHVVLDMEGGARITFNDARRFGAMDLVATEQAEAHWLLAGLGPEPLGNAFDEDYLVARLRGRNTPVKARFWISGSWRGSATSMSAKPCSAPASRPGERPGASGKRRVRSLVPVIRQVLADAIEAGGSSLRDYRQADGELGYFSTHSACTAARGNPAVPGLRGSNRAHRPVRTVVLLLCVVPKIA
jgi:formamidopyrimidine-DNA glycosylase